MVDDDPGRGQRRLLPYGDRAALLECRDAADSRAMHRWLLEHRGSEIAELVPGARTVLLRLDAPMSDAFVTTMLDVRPREADVIPAATIEVDVDYDGDDLAEVARLLGLTEEALIDRHTGQDWVVAFCGFAPGFGYLAATEESFQVPRRTSPRTRVPAGSVALADSWSAVYPTASPGGWQLIGSTDLTLFDPEADPPALLTPGTRVRFRAARS